MRFEEYVSYQAPPGYRDELIHGEVRLAPAPKPDHQDICIRLQDLLRGVVPDSSLVRFDMTLHIGPEEGPLPDVLVIGKDRWMAARARHSYPEGSPELAIEVLSPSNKEQEMLDKKDLYLAHGSLACWIVDPETKTVTVWQKRICHKYRYEDSIPLPSAIGGGLVRVADIFEC